MWQIDKNIKLGLERVKKATEALNIPLDEPDSVLIGGTNGKGTTALFLAKILQLHGIKTMVYTSPHLYSPSERMLVEGNPTPEEKIREALGKVEERCGSINLTPFERFTMAFLLLAKEIKPDLLILEVGLGGRLDATNVLNNRVSIITSVSLDHQEYLGKTIGEIAREKAGIIKESSETLVGKVPKIAKEIIKEQAKRLKARCLFLGEGIEIEITRKNPLAFNLQWEEGKLEGLKINTIFPFFAENASLAAVTAHLILKNLSPDLVRKALESVPLPARGEIFEFNGCKAVVDTAHNPHALCLLLKRAKEALPLPLRVVLSPLKDKHWQKMIKIAQAYGKLFLVEQDTERGLKRDDFPQGNWISLEEALKIPKRGTVIYAGSFWMAREARRFFACQR